MIVSEDPGPRSSSKHSTAPHTSPQFKIVIEKKNLMEERARDLQIRELGELGRGGAQASDKPVQYSKAK